MSDIFKNIDDRAMTDIGARMMIKGASGKYSLFVPVTNIPATGSAPEQVEKTVTTSKKKSYMEGRQDSPQKECTFYAHRDNFMKLAAAKNVEQDFLQVNPDGTGFKFSGFVSYYQDEVSVGNNITGKYVITVTKSDADAISNVMDLVEDTVIFTSSVPNMVTVDHSATDPTYAFKVVLDPSDATVTAESDTTGVATVAVSSGTVTITAVAAGTAIIKLTASKTGCASNFTTVLVTVE